MNQLSHPILQFFSRRNGRRPGLPALLFGAVLQMVDAGVQIGEREKVRRPRLFGGALVGVGLLVWVLDVAQAVTTGTEQTYG